MAAPARAEPAAVAKGSEGAPARERARRWKELTSREFDLAVVGGGITGAGIAALAARRGMHVALVEREDFGSGTSGATSKMLHGGLRYLQQRKFGLVREALHERGRLFRSLGPERIQRTEFLLPLQGSFGHRTGLRFGTWLYQRLAGASALGPRTVLSREEVGRRVPHLVLDGVRGGVLYPEGVVDDVLLTLTRVGEASEKGALVLNHVEALAPLLEGGKVRGVRLRDRRTREEGELRAKSVVNSSGVWAGSWAGADRTPALRPSKGVHLVFPRDRLPLDVAVVLSAPEGRWVFALPFGPLTIVGTTDTEYEGDPQKVRAEPSDIRYLMEVARHNFPGQKLSTQDLVDVYAGLRPLLAGGAERTNDLSREDVVHVDPSGLLTVAGGKLTTHRAMAERALSLVGGPPGANGGEEEGWSSWSFPPGWSRTPCPGAELFRRALEAAPTERSALLSPWVERSIQVAGAETLSDLIDRRFHSLQRLDPRFPQVVGEVARLASPLLGWSDAELLREREDYLFRARSDTQAVLALREDPRSA